MDLGKIVSALKKERDQLDKAIAALELVGTTGGTSVKSVNGVKSTPPATVGRTAKKRRHRLTPEGRKRLSEMMKRRWAERRKKIASIRKPTKKAA